MMTRFALTALAGLGALALTACNSPSPAYMGAPQAKAEAGGMSFAVRRKGSAVEVVRTSAHVLPDRAAVMTNAGIAIRKATGCPVRPGTLAGDYSVLRAEIDC